MGFAKLQIVQTNAEIRKAQSVLSREIFPRIVYGYDCSRRIQNCCVYGERSQFLHLSTTPIATSFQAKAPRCCVSLRRRLSLNERF